jgi:hypothetical protein
MTILACVVVPNRGRVQGSYGLDFDALDEAAQKLRKRLRQLLNRGACVAYGRQAAGLPPTGE